MASSDFHVNQSDRIVLNQGSLQTILVNVEDDMNLEIDIPENTKGNCYMTISGNGVFRLNVNVEPNSDWSILMMNESDDSLSFDENWNIKKNAQVYLSIGELTSGNHVKSALFHLLEEGSSINVRGANLVQSKLIATLKAIHYKGNTTAQIDNYGIVLQECEYTLDVIGQIEKAAKNAKTHQISRVMNFGLRPKTSVNPKLIIDENDVEASHAASMGQPDVLQVHYLQSRGLNRSEALKLISLGYLLPIVDVIEDEIVKEKLKDAVIEKVNQSCLM
jgi:Fe-S cluster assembly protein SufD